MAAPNKDMVTLGPWPKGANNVAREDSLPQGACRYGKDVDFLDDGKTRRRFGSTTVATLAGVENMWSNGHFALCTAGTGLYRFVPATGFTQINDQLQLDADVCYTEVNTDVYVSDGVTALRVSMLDDSVEPWGVATPLRNPVGVATANGGFDGGTYQYSITLARADGEEGGALPSEQIVVPDGGGITLSNFPPVSADIASFVIYITACNGYEEAVQTIVPSNVTTVDLFKVPLGRALTTQLFVPMPAGQCAVQTLSRLFVAKGKFLIYSEWLQYGLTDPENYYFAFPDEITMIAATGPMARSQGLFVGTTSRTYFLPGSDPAQWTLDPAYSDGALLNSNTMVPGEYFKKGNLTSALLPVWISAKGSLCMGMSDGSVSTPTSGNYVMATGDRVSAISRELNGIRQMLFTMRPPKMESKFMTQDSLTIGRFKNGVPVRDPN